MFGKRGSENAAVGQVETHPAAREQAARAAAAPKRAVTPALPAGEHLPSSPPTAPSAPPPVHDNRRSESFYEVKGQIFGALIEAIDLAQLAKLDGESAREEIRDIVNEIIAIKNIVM